MATPTARPPINPFLANDPNAKAKRLARALVSDIVAYFPQKREEGLREPLPFLPASGWDAYANTDDDKGWSAAETRWTGARGQSWAEGGTLSTRLALRSREPFAGDPAIDKQFRKLSREIFDALLTGDVPAHPGVGARA